MAYKRILVPVDGSPTSGLGLREAIDFAKARKARLQLVHVVDVHNTRRDPRTRVLIEAPARTVAGSCNGNLDAVR